MNNYLNKLCKTLSYIMKINIIKTLVINLKYFGFKGFLFPIIIGRNVELKNLKGKIYLKDFKTGIVHMGLAELGHYSTKSNSSIFNNTGKIFFKGKCSFGPGTCISNNGILIFGNKFCISANSKIICEKRICFGDNNLISWNTQISDTDAHKIYDNKGILLNPNKSILFGNNIWLNAGVVILKGVKIANNVVVAANSIISKSIIHNNICIGSNNKILKTEIYWEM